MWILSLLKNHLDNAVVMDRFAIIGDFAGFKVAGFSADRANNGNRVGHLNPPPCGGRAAV